ncbi:LysM peptidoglycan-binding domain-containing protein [Yoonia sp. 2307UL14-13]|uniref:LysM peptidoglycan-binding domain-containing protein n=1 Tax=Yoonia sp. 2307UL14-13 TaxID=3126506 RepID=UPI0030A6050F
MLGMVSASAGHAQAQCSQYSVVRGDTLSEIAGRAAVPGGFQVLFNANTDILTSPNLLEVGQVLKIPCADGSLPDADGAQVATAAVQPTAQAAATAQPIRFLTASGYAPFTEEDLPEGGLFTQMVRRSMELGGPDQEFRIIFVNDWGAHLTDLLPSGAFDMGFPWFLPDCTKVDNLSPANAMRCTEFDASAPFYDAVVGYYTLNGSAYVGATEYTDLYGATLCRPDGWFSFDLEGEGLIDPNVDLIFAKNEEACWEMMLAGDVDVITYDALPAEEDFAELGIADRVTTLDSLASKQTLHVFVPKDHPDGAAYLAMLNAGQEQLRISGEWFEIVRSNIQTTVEN